MSTRVQLQQRLSVELNDDVLAERISTTLPDALVGGIELMTQGEVATSEHLNYRHSTIAADNVTVLWAFAYGYRYAPGSTPEDRVIPPREQLLPGPVNEAIAERLHPL